MSDIVLVLILGLSLQSAAGTMLYARGQQAGAERRNVLDQDYASAHEALKGAMARKDIAQIRAGLEHPVCSIRKEAAEALGHLGDVCAIPDLLRALAANQGATMGGSEVRGMQWQLNVAMVEALERLTGIATSTGDFKNANGLEASWGEDPEVRTAMGKYWAWWNEQGRSTSCQ